MNSPSIAVVYLAEQPDLPILNPHPDSFLSANKGAIILFHHWPCGEFIIRGKRIPLRDAAPEMEVNLRSTVRPITGVFRFHHLKTFGLN